MTESTLVRIIRGLPAQMESAITEQLIICISAARAEVNVSTTHLFDYLKAAAVLMIPLPDYDVSDFNEREIENDLALLAADDASLWIQLLHALDDRHSGQFARLKELSPYAGKYLMFFDVTGNAATLKAELDDQLADELMRRADAHVFADNNFAAVITPETLDQIDFVDGVDQAPATV